MTAITQPNERGTGTALCPDGVRRPFMMRNGTAIVQLQGKIIGGKVTVVDGVSTFRPAARHHGAHRMWYPDPTGTAPDGVDPAAPKAPIDPFSKRDVSDEPRGQPDNAGEWTSGSGGGGKSPEQKTPLHQPIPLIAPLSRVSAPHPSAVGPARAREAASGVEPPKRLEVSLLDSAGKGDLKGTNAGGMEKSIRRQMMIPGFEDLDPSDPATAAETTMDRQQANIKDMVDLSTSLSPAGTKAHARWYPIANQVCNEWAAASKSHFPVQAVIADVAILSPGQDWADNLAWGKFVLDTVDNQDHLTVTQDDIDGLDAARQAAYEFALKDKKRSAPPKPPKKTDLVPGSTVASLSDMQVAEYLRGHGEAIGKVKQMGGRPGFGDPQSIARPSTFQFLANAVSVLRNPTPANIDDKLGEQLKVRSFFNNISEPLDAKYQDVTADTHHFGVANGIPFGVSHPLMKSGPMNITATPKIAATGAMGTYPFVVEATRRATTDANATHGDVIGHVEPNQTQSIAWTMWKALYPSIIRKAPFQKFIGEQHSLMASGKIDRATMNLNIEAERLKFRDAQQEKFAKIKDPDKREEAISQSKRNGAYIPTWDEIATQFDQEARDMEATWPTNSPE